MVLDLAAVAVVALHISYTRSNRLRAYPTHDVL